MGQVIAFKGNLPSMPINHFQKSLGAAKDEKGVTSGDKQFLKLLKNGGYWVYGAKDTEVEEGSKWAINPMSLQTGYVAWKGGRPVGKKMKSIFNPPLYTEADLHDVGAKWDEAVAFDLVCISGEDVGTVCEYSANNYGGKQAFTALLDALMKQSSIDADMIVPIVTMTSDSYEHREYGKIYNPIFEIVEWGSMSNGAGGDEPTPNEAAAADTTAVKAPPVETKAPEPEQPRRRRGAAAAVTDVPAETKTPEPETPVRRQRRRAS